MLCCHLVHVSCGVEVALTVVEGPVGDAFFGVCAVPRFTEVLCASVDAAQRGFDGAHVRVCCLVVCADLLVPVVVYEAGAVAFDADGDGHGVDVADVGGEVSLLFVGETVPRVGERVHDREVCGAGTEGRCGFGDLVDLGGVHGWVSFSLVVGVFLVLVLVSRMCGRVCSLSRVKGGRERCWACHACPVVWGAAGLLVACVGVGGLRFLGVAGDYWRVVGEGVFPPLFLLLPVFPWVGGEAKGGGWGFGFFLTRGFGGRCGWFSYGCVGSGGWPIGEMCR